MHPEVQPENSVLHCWNGLDAISAAAEILPCCGSTRWADRLAAQRPFSNTEDIFQASSEIWHSLEISDWDEAFRSHPRIGESTAPPRTTAKSAEWSVEEQASAVEFAPELGKRLQKGNAAYEQRFGRIYIVCATGKSMEELVDILECRLKNDENKELVESVEQQRQIIEIRLKKWLSL